MKRKNIIKIFIMLIVFLTLLCVAFPFYQIYKIDLELLLLFIIIGFISIIEIIKDVINRPCSLCLMHWIFIFFFFFLAPFLQSCFNYHPWGIVLSSDEKQLSCIFILIWIICYKIGIILSKRIFNKRIILYDELGKQNGTIDKKSCTKLFLFFSLILSLISAIIIIKNVGLSNLFSRNSYTLTYDGNYSKMGELIIGHCTKAIIVFSFSMNLLYFFQKKDNKFLLLISTMILLITCFPTGLARNTAGTIYMGIFVIFNYKNINKFKNSLKYLILFVIAFMIVFPAINVFRNLDFTSVKIVDVLSKTVSSISENYLSGDYDAFSLIGSTISYVNYHDITYGKQLAGSLFFFIPRNIWKSKPGGSGQLVFTTLGQKYTNISSPMVAESYINFGIIGVIVIAIIFGYLCAYIDCRYWDYIDNNGYDINYLIVLYPFLLPSFFFLLRGDWQSTFAYMCVYIFIFYILFKFKNISIKNSYYK